MQLALLHWIMLGCAASIFLGAVGIAVQHPNDDGVAAEPAESPPEQE
jgi:hypothetical protein